MNASTPLADRPLEKAVTTLKLSEIENYLANLPDWSLATTKRALTITRGYTFKNFKNALSFANQIGQLAEEFNHHPDLYIGWGKCTVVWWTHAISGLHLNDFIMAAKTDRLYAHL